MNTVTAKRDLLDNCRNSEYREALVFENVYTGVCSQIRVLREQRELSQAEFGRKAKMAQERISILEDPNAETKPTLKTLLRMASAFDVGLDVRFVPFETILDRSVNTESSALEVPSFDEELPELEKRLEAEDLSQQINPTKDQESERAISAAEKNLREQIRGPLTKEHDELLRQHLEGRARAGALSYDLIIKPSVWSTLQPTYPERAFPPAFSPPFAPPFGTPATAGQPSINFKKPAAKVISIRQGGQSFGIDSPMQTEEFGMTANG